MTRLRVSPVKRVSLITEFYNTLTDMVTSATRADYIQAMAEWPKDAHMTHVKPVFNDDYNGELGKGQRARHEALLMN
ncbi:hypothetical protein E2C01_098466 [Portunus trituberculatus]|uniref:Uncharacterized protein n=1 Tax=Portunus trituberculatus TaxID=210409 RepID=A0A5B7K723_PORTR|nr:hypothetical protein [Portunus trituberculatus]